AANQSGSASASLFSSAINSESDAANPWLFPAQKPTLAWLRINLNRKAGFSGNSCSAISDEPSSDPLSTTITSNGCSNFCRVSDCRHDLKRSRRFHVPTTTEIVPVRYLFTDC